MNKSSHFTLTELTRSATARCLGIDNTPSEEITGNLARLCALVLEPIRQAWGGPIRITSGYRCPVLNAAVGGVGNSAHLRGLAADIVPVHGTAKSLFRKIEAMLKNPGAIPLPVGQLIDERNYRWVHVSLAEDSHLQPQVLHLR